MRAVFPTVVLCVGACIPDGTELDVNGGVAGDLPANAKIILFGTVRDLAFVRIDRGAEEPLAHTVVGDGFENFGYVVEPGDVEPGETITISAECETCSTIREITFGLDADLTAPGLPAQAPTATAAAIRRAPLDPLITSYEVNIRAPAPAEQTTLLLRLEGEGVDVLRVNNSFEPGSDLDVSFQVDGGLQRRLCARATLMDLAGNTTELPEEVCTDLDASTSPYGQCAQPPG